MVWGILVSAGKPIDATRIPLVLGLLLFAPAAVIGSTGQAIGRPQPLWLEYRPLNTFLNVRPIPSAGLVAGKLRLALAIVVSTWVFVLIGTCACFVLSRSLPGVATVWQRFTSAYPGIRAPLICLLVCVLMPMLMFRLLTDGFPFALTGRKWLANGLMLAYLVLFVSLISAVAWLAQHPSDLLLVVKIGPWVVALLAILKAGAAAVAFRWAFRQRLTDWPAIRRALATWLAFTAAVIALGLLLELPANVISKPSLLVNAATFAPLVRFPLSAISMDWNRHR